MSILARVGERIRLEAVGVWEAFTTPGTGLPFSVIHPEQVRQLRERRRAENLGAAAAAAETLSTPSLTPPRAVAPLESQPPELPPPPPVAPTTQG